MNTRNSKTCARFAGASALAIGLAIASQTLAQEAAPTASVEEVVVTGSRVARAGFLAPTPTTVVSTTLLNTSAQSNIGGLLNNLPAFKADYSPSGSGPRSFDSPGATFANLRGLGSSRTLALVDGRRLTPTTANGQSDLNLIPSLLIQNVDVVTGGASAAYGSDAVAGVVNIRMKKNLQGFIGNASYGQSMYDDLKDYVGALAFGTSFDGGKGHFMVGGEYDKNKGTGTAYTRPWGAQEWGIMPNPAAVLPTALPTQLLVAQRHASNVAIGGLVQSGPLKGTVFTTPAGGTRQFQYGSLVGPSFQVGGEGGGLAYTSLLMNPLTRQSYLARLDYDLSPAISLYGEASYAKSSSLSTGSSPVDSTGLTLQRTNPYLPASIVAAMTAANVTSLAIGRNNTDLGIYTVDVRTKTQRYVFGGDGSLGGSWKWDAYAQYGQTDYINNIINARDQTKFKNAVDARLNAAGQIVCGINQTTVVDSACVPINIVGDGAISAAGRAYVMGTETYALVYKQSVEAFNLHGAPFSTWAGEVSLAAGIEHRHETANGVPDAVSAVGGWHVGNQRPITGKFNVTEGYAEAVTPLLRDSPIGKLFEVDTAVRLTDYSTSGRVTTWKVGLNWELTDEIRLRATRSRDIRAANITELFAQGVSAQQPIIDPVTKVNNNATNLTIGNASLTPEKADTKTIGVVLKPRFLSGFDLSVDYYNINLKDAIASLTGQRIVDLCATGTASLCPYVIRNAAGVITQVTLARFNIASIKTSGFDIEARYRHDLNFLGPKAGDLTFQYLGTRTKHIIVNDLNTVIDYVGDVGSSARGAYGTPKWRWSFLTTYSNGPFSATGTVRYVGGGNLNNTYSNTTGAVSSLVNTVTNNAVVPSVTYFDLALSYDILKGKAGRSVQVYGIVQNLFNKAPPIVPTQVSQTNPVIYDVIGRQYRAGVRFSF